MRFEGVVFRVIKLLGELYGISWGIIFFVVFPQIGFLGEILALFWSCSKATPTEETLPPEPQLHQRGDFFYNPIIRSNEE
jgi:hypothetical protein